MAIVTAGHINASWLRLKSPATEAEMLQLLRQAKYKGVVGTSGWGTPETDNDEWIGKSSFTRPTANAPRLRAATSKPERVLARLYFDRIDPKLVARFDRDVPDELTHVLEAVDVLMVRGGDSWDVLVSSQNGYELRHFVEPALRQLATGDHGGNDPVQPPGGAFGVDSDLFLWLIYRFNGDQVLAGNLILEDVRAIQALDGALRRTRLYEEVGLDRRELLAVIANQGMSYGPAKFALRYEDLGVSADLELKRDGSFSAHVGHSRYDDDIDDRRELGIRLFEDVALEIVPSLRAAYAADSKWHGTARNEFIRTADQALRN